MIEDRASDTLTLPRRKRCGCIPGGTARCPQVTALRARVRELAERAHGERDPEARRAAWLAHHRAMQRLGWHLCLLSEATG